MDRLGLITRFIAWFPDAENGDRDELARTANRLGPEFHLWRKEPYVLAVAAPTAPTAPDGLDTADWLLDVFPGTAASARLAAANFRDAKSVEDVHRVAETSAQCYNLLHATQAHFLLESDALGLKPAYAARTPGGHVLASRIADILQLFPALAGPTDAVALYELLGFWAPLMGRTLHQRIRRTPPGACYRWTAAEGLSGRRDRELRPTTVEPLWFMDRAIEAIRDASSQSLKEKTQGASRPVVLALSGGFDSRFIAALCRDEHIDVRAVSFGRRHHSETHSAKAIANVLGLKLEIIPQFTDGTLRDLPRYLDVMEGTADPAALSIMNLYQASLAPASSILHGFCGDVQAGMHIGRFSAADYASREAVADAVMRRYYPSDRADLYNLFNPAAHPDDVRQDILSHLRTDCPPYQAYALWYLESRNRVYVAAQCAMLGETFDPVMPFYDRRLFAIWHSIPPAALVNRSVYRSLMARYYPALARIPHPEEAAPITPNLHWQLARFYRSVPHRLLAAGVGAKRADRIALRLYRDDNIYSLSKLHAPQQRRYMLSELMQLAPALKDGLGVELSSGYAAVLSGDVQALRTMFAVALYAQRRCRSDYFVRTREFGAAE